MATATSIQAYHNHQGKPTQRLRVAAFCEQETKAGRLVWISKIVEHFMRRGEVDLAQKSTVAPRFKELKADGIEYNGRRYVLKHVKSERPTDSQPVTEMWAFVIDQPAQAAHQLEMF